MPNECPFFTTSRTISPKKPTHKTTCETPLAFSNRNWCAMNGSPFASSSDLGIFSVAGLSRVANPPASIATGNINSSLPLRTQRLSDLCADSFSSGVRDNRSPTKIKPKSHFPQSRPAHRFPHPCLLLRIQQQKSSASRADNLSAQGPILSPQFIQLINRPVAHPRRPFLLMLPVRRHQLRKLPQIALHQCIAALHSKLLREMQISQHLRAIFFALRILIPQNLRSRPRRPRKKQQQIIFQVSQSLRRQSQRRNIHLSIRQKLKTSNPAKRRNVLILLTHRLLQKFNLNPASLLR